MKEICIAFCRMNPPTSGHELLVNTVRDACENSRIYLSHSHDSKKNPLTYEQKIKYCTEAFGDIVHESAANNMYQVMEEVYKEGFTHVKYACGSDRLDDAERLKAYNGKTTKAGNILFDFENIEVVKVGEDRINEDLPTSKISASLLRSFAAENDLENFVKYCPSNLSDESRINMYRDVRAGLGLEQLNEAAMSTDDIIKHDYYQRVVDNLGADGVILKNGDVKKETNSEVLNKLQSLLSIEDKRERVQQFNSIAGFKWSEIDKQYYSGKGGNSGQSAGENAEPYVCYYFNHYGEDIENNTLDAAWTARAKNMAARIAEQWSPEDWVAVHVNGRDIEPLNPMHSIIGAIFKSKDAAEEALHLEPGTLANLYRAHKDNWNKADIVLVRKDVNVLEYLTKVKSSAEFNNTLINLSRNGANQLIVPLSLKSTGNKKISEITITPEGFDSKGLDIVRVDLIMPMAVADDSNNCSCYLHGFDVDNNMYSVQFRRQTNSEDKPSIEIQLPNARGGKALSAIKEKLGLSGDDWYKFPIQSEDALINTLSSHFDMKYTPTEKLERYSSDCKYPWWSRTCFRTLLALYEQYRNKYSGNAIDFFTMLFEAGSKGTGAFFVVK